MHLYIFVRGKFTQVEEWKAHAQAAYWKWRRINKNTGQEEVVLVQGALRPSVLGVYEYVFPKEALAEVCAFFGITRNYSYGFSRLGIELRHASLRKIFGSKKIPDSALDSAKEIPDTYTTAEYERGFGSCIIPGVAIHAIGIKEDKQITLGDYIQEAL